MIFAYTLCITTGLILGSLQIVRRSVISSLGYNAIMPYFYDDGFYGWQAFLLFLFSLPAIAAIFYVNPWVIVDNFVAGREGVAIAQFSIVKLITFLAFLGIGEVSAVYYHSYKFNNKQSGYKSYASSKPKYKYDPDMMDNWRKWRRQYANSGHPDWVPPGKESAQSKASDGIYTNPDRRKALQTLNAPTNASAKTIHRHYFKMAKKHHPDMVLNADSSTAAKERAEQRMSEINAAYDWLKNNP